MTQFTKNVMCAECPFRANAPPGGLGNYTVDQLHALIHENNQHLLCHMHVKEVLESYTDDDDEDVSADRLLDNWGEHCVGALRYMSSVCRLANDRECAEAQRQVCQSLQSLRASSVRRCD